MMFDMLEAKLPPPKPDNNASNWNTHRGVFLSCSAKPAPIAGRTNRAVKEDIRLRVYWTPKDWIVPKPVENPDGMAMVIGYMYDLPKIEKAGTIMLN